MHHQTNMKIMTTRTRKKIGVTLAVLAPVVFVALALGGIQLVTMSSRYFEETGATSSAVRLHWPLVIPFVMFIIGVALTLFSPHEKAA
jgi:TRAP-type C4-dicarboxylate transport system permease small subunit